MTADMRALRAAVWAGRTAGGRLRASARGEVAALIERAHTAGTGYEQMARELGVAPKTVRQWSEVRQSALSPVLVVDAQVAPARGLIVYGPRGLRVEGLSLDELAGLRA